MSEQLPLDFENNTPSADDPGAAPGVEKPLLNPDENTISRQYGAHPGAPDFGQVRGLAARYSITQIKHIIEAWQLPQTEVESAQDQKEDQTPFAPTIGYVERRQGLRRPRSRDATQDPRLTASDTQLKRAIESPEKRATLIAELQARKAKN